MFYRQQLFEYRQQLLDGQLNRFPTPSKMMRVHVRSTAPELEPENGITTIDDDGLEWMLYLKGNSCDPYRGRNVWQISLELLPLLPLDGLPDIPLLHSRIEEIRLAPSEEIERQKADHPSFLGPFKLDLWPVEVSRDDPPKSDYVDLHFEDDYYFPGLQDLDKLQQPENVVGLQYVSTADYIVRGLVWKELEIFRKEATAFLTQLKIYLSFEREISTIYRNNFRQNFDGAPDLSKVAGEISIFLRKESVVLPNEVYGWTEKERRDRVAETIAWIVSQYIGNQPKPVVRDGVAFEEQIAAGLEELNFIVDRTPVSGDFGADLVAEKDDLRYAIQCKAHSKPIGIKAVQEANGARRFYKCDYGVVIATSRFTPAAQELAQETGVILAGEADLARLEFLIDG
ncbi:restriction endonuclease [Agrobacterium pusense]|uniref:restriction endonuclease n=1 Tax=Agrobacterium pusense TaxID=648995 RepID=UPI000D3C67F6|nr:restriction endonuclease [Agrobacterium pusense]PTV70263.1 hypothetical protein DBL06_25720 [Agrobacterium pusense]